MQKSTENIKEFPIHSINPFKDKPFYGFSRWDIPREEKIELIRRYVMALNLTKPGAKLLIYILSETDLTASPFILERKYSYKSTGFKSVRSHYIAITDLLNNKILARTNLNYKFFINPKVFPTKEKLIALKNEVA